jgi:RNA polymerase sigma factor (sigma-70 family)
VAARKVQDSVIQADDPRARAAAVVTRHEAALLRVARHFSLCHDDALDAYQRALEIYVRRLETVDPETELGWLKVVVRHEAMAIRRARSDAVVGDDLDLDAVVPAPDRPVEDLIASSERVRRSAEALRALKPDEARALVMKAHGLSYAEIGKRCGWSYTKVNRVITEGRRRFLRAFAGIEAGEECERFAPIVAALAAGTASSTQILEIRPHLRHCATCRAAVRDLHLSWLRRASLFWPLFVVEPARRLFHRSSSADAEPLVDADEIRPLEEFLRTNPDLPGSATPDPVNLPVPEVGDHGIRLGLPAPPDVPDKDVVLEQVPRLTQLKHDLLALLHRANASDVATGVHIASAGGGGRLSTIATVLALCLSSVGAGTMCVVTGLVSVPPGLFSEDRARPKPRAADEPRRPRRETPSPTPTAPLRSASAQPTATATPKPSRDGREPRRNRDRNRRRGAPSAADDPAQGTAPTSHENPPISPPATPAVSQESFTPEAPPAPSAPAAAPATGGSEFRP